MYYKLLILVLLIGSCENTQKTSCQKNDYDNLEEALINKECVKKLYLRNQKFKSIPIEIFEFRNLEELDLGANLITFLPNEFSRLEKLKDLSLSYNQINVLGNGISKLKKLEVLWLLDNKIESLPDHLCELTNLTELNLNGNPLTDIPDCIVLGNNIKEIYIESFTEENIMSEERKSELSILNPKCKIFN